jgi:hypothetical protein
VWPRPGEKAADDHLQIAGLLPRPDRRRAVCPLPTSMVTRRLEYVEWARQVSEGLTGVSPWLEKEFEQAAQQAERSTVFHR